ncbi:hypothetical protein LCGC14_0294500 [marine sediment metagenome]|uniref:Uncharacterized protein n=1 Tax=marine sediment metagenome TaxID=412755 RepID=A0A0F9U912_9ZZZZ
MLKITDGYCQAHKTKPDPEGVRNCYGELWICEGCKRVVCAGFGCADEAPDLCDDCWTDCQAAKQDSLEL